MFLTWSGKLHKTDANVLITGENGTGKELIAQEIHRLSARAKEVLVSVDIGSLSETLFESELFGHVKGAFTDARENRQGKFEIADKGTLFLDEIGNLSFHLQAKLLTAIENRQITRIGSNQPIPTDIRLICATNRNLESMVEEGLFREDLLYRINTILIDLPPLRDRGNDIIILAEFFLKKYSFKYKKPEIKINQQAHDKLLNYSWPGNIRELQHTIEKAVILSESSVLKADDLYLKNTNLYVTNYTSATLDEMEKQMIRLALEKNNGNFTAAADQLGITRQTLYNKLKKSRSMISRRIYFSIILRVILILIFSLLAGYAVYEIKSFRFAVILAVMITILTISLITYLNSTNRKIRFFFDSVRNDDSNLFFPVDAK